MFRTIVVGHDGTEHADAAVALALELRDPEAGRLVLTAIARGEHARARAAERLTRVAEALPPDVPVETEVLEALSPVAGLAVLAAARDADLVVLGPTHRGEFGRVTGRTTVQRILHGAPCAVAVAGARTPQLKEGPRVLVPYDASPAAEAALPTAYAIASATGGSVRLCRVLAPVTARTEHGAFAESVAEAAGRDREARAALEAAAARAPAGVAVECRVVHGDPADRLVEESLDADLLVLGSRHRAQLRRAVSGSVAAALLTRCELPVIVTARTTADRTAVGA